MGFIVLLPKADTELALPGGEGVVIDDDELLVGGRVQEKAIAVAGQDLTELYCHLDGMAADLKV